MLHKLIIYLNETEQSLIYQGASHLRKNLVDEVSIFYDKIILTFDRSKPVSLKTSLFSSNSLLRYELQKALCFYLAVRGILPEVQAITLEKNEDTQSLEDLAFAQKWHKCRVARRLDPSIAASIFQHDAEAKASYIAMTFYLKAQLDHFSHDRFRAAWSGFNALYTTFTSEAESEEWKKIKATNRYFELNELKEARQIVSGLDEAFWNKLDWYSFTRNLCTDKNGKVKKIDNVKQSVYSLRDAMLITRVSGYMKSVVYTDQEGNYGKKADYQRCAKEIERNIKANDVSYVARARFLVVDYCYMLRNRSFHANKAYPLFMFDSGEEECTVEDILTKLLLITIEGILKANMSTEG